MNSILKNIDDIVDPTKNSINENRARIKEAFLRKLKNDIARIYYITGEHGEPKLILYCHNHVYNNL